MTSWIDELIYDRSVQCKYFRWSVSINKLFLKTAEFTRKPLCWCVWISFSDIPTQVLFVNFEIFLKILFLQNIYERLLLTKTIPANIYLFKRRQWRHSDVIIDFEHILHLFLVFLLLTLNKQMLTGMWLGELRFIWVCLTILWGWYLKD